MRCVATPLNGMARGRGLIARLVLANYRAGFLNILSK